MIRLKLTNGYDLYVRPTFIQGVIELPDGTSLVITTDGEKYHVNHSFDEWDE